MGSNPHFDIYFFLKTFFFSSLFCVSFHCSYDFCLVLVNVSSENILINNIAAFV